MTLLPSDPRSTAPAVPVGPAAESATRAAQGAPPPPPPGEAGPVAPADRLDLSDAARTTSASPATDAALETAQVALRSGSEMSDARLHDLRERVRTGYYDQPEAVGRLAEAAARDLTGSTPS